MNVSPLLASALRQLTMGIHVAIYLAAFAVALAAVRPRHRSAGALMAVASAMLALEMVAWPALSFLSARVGADVGSFYAVASFLMALWAAAAWALLLLGLVRLAARVPPDLAGQGTPGSDAGR
jgi:hypothetical protein